MSLRVNPLRTTETRFGAALAAQGFNPTLCEPGLFQVRAPGAISEIPGFAEGHFSIQDQAAFQVAQRMAPRATWRILDLCAAPGGKSTHLAELTEDRATIYATDRDAKRLRRVRENADRLRLASVNTLAWQSAQQGGPFDAVLLDVPCSNTGVLAKRIEVRYRLTPSVCEALRATQLDLLVRAADLVTEEGLICYSTCSVQPQENETLVRAFLAQDGRYRLREECLMLPSADAPDHDGGYVAILARACGSPD